ncbi:MAG: type IV pilus modification protein PilV [Sinimarinibacterium flocculans]|uniref:type IV pilus modification protein PilV n=1 Tax=Sinimarinibacterium flocculans TaxID=985250 RepID=UPI003C5F53AD
MLSKAPIWGRGARGQRGLTLIEVLVAVLVIAVGLLGLAGLQFSALANNYLSYQTMQATALAESMVDRMRANVDGLDSYALSAGNTPSSPSKNCGSGDCSPEELAAWDLAYWYAMVSDDGSTFSNIPSGPRGALPSGRASVVCSDAICTDESIRVVTVYWDPARAGASTYGCDPDDPKDFRCFRLTFVP